MASGTSSPVGGVDLGGSAPLSVSMAAATTAVASDVTLEWDFDNDGDFDEAEEDITPYVLSAQTSQGRDYPSNLFGRSSPGEMRLTLNNDDDRFSYFNSSSPLNTDPFSLKTGRRVRLRAGVTDTGAATISYVGIGASSAGSNVSVVPALPTGLAVGDLMLVFATIRNSGTGTVSTPWKWANVLTSGNVTLLAKYYEAGDTAPTVAFSGGVANATTTAQCMAFRGVHPQLTRAIVASTSQLNATSVNVAIPALTATAKAWMPDPDVVATVVGFWRQDDATSAATLSTMTEISDSASSLGDDAHTGVQYRLGGTAGSAIWGSTTVTMTGSLTAISRALVVQLAPAVATDDPVLLASDSFNGADGVPLATDDLGNAWTFRAGAVYRTANGRARVSDGADAVYGTYHVSTVQTNTTDHYVQAQLSYPVQVGGVGVVARYVDSSNMVRAYLQPSTSSIVVEERKAGVTTEIGEWFTEFWEGMTIGLEVINQKCALYIGGAPMYWDVGRYLTLSNTITGTNAGLISYWYGYSDLPPQVDNFRVWDRTATTIPGRIWTGTVQSVKTSVAAGALKVVDVTCKADLIAATSQDVPAPRITRSTNDYSPSQSVPAGAVVGDIMARCGLQSPPHPVVTESTSRLGPVSMKDGKALDLARQVELTDRGFLMELPEGGVTYEASTTRASASSLAWFTDTPGSGQYGFETIEPHDHEGRIVNRAVAQVAPTCPTVVDVSNDADDDPASLDVILTVPEVIPGDLVLVFISCSAVQADRQWYEPPGWTKHRDVGDDGGIRIYSLIADGTESATAVTFLKTETQGTSIIHTYVIRDWYGTDDGIKVGRVSSGAIGGTNAYPVSPGWNRAPALYINFQGVIGSASGILWDDFGSPPPKGYNYNNLEGLTYTGTAVYQTGVESIYKLDVTDTENPGPWEGVFTDYLLLESVVVAIRGYNGPLVKPTIEDSKATVKDGLVVTVEDVASQLDHGFIRSNQDVPALFYTEADAEDWCDSVLAEYADDRPVITISFTATKNAGLRTQAIERRLSDKITVTASGNAGLGIEGEFHIEHISHEFDHGTTSWRTVWELSPA